MKNIKQNEIEIIGTEIGKIKHFLDDEVVLFFPIDLENQVTENDSGISMFTASTELTKGSNGAITYGVIADKISLGDGRYQVHAALYSKDSAIMLNLNDFLSIFKTVNPDSDINTELVKDLECRILKKGALLFRVK